MRGIWTVCMILGVALFGASAVLLAHAALSDPEALRTPRALVAPVLLIIMAGACGAGLFMSPREFKETLKQDEAEPAEWVKQMRADTQEPDERRP
ncbi:MAG: hypothetical protein AB7Q23_05165 [Hyphomonadaceae bacterium]